MAFEIFQATGTRNREFISVTENKTFGLSRAFIDKYGITKNHKAVVMYDQETEKVALHFSLNNPKFGFAVRIPNEKHGGNVVARSFFDRSNIDVVKYAQRYDDFEVLTLKELGFPEKQGDAFVLQLSVKPPAVAPRSATEDVVIEDIEDVAINLDDIPF